MLQTLIRIPLEGPWSLGPLGEVPGFGFGIVLLAWSVVAALWIVRHRRELDFNKETLVPAAVWLVVAAVILFVPHFVRSHYERILETSERIVRSADPRTPEFLNAYSERDRAWWALREYETAIETYREEIARDPTSPLPSQSLAWLLATCPEEKYRDGDQAVELATLAIENRVLPDPVSVDVLSAACAEARDFENAVRQAQRAAELSYRVKSGPERARLQGIRRRLQLFLSEAPFRDVSAQHSFPASAPVYGYGFMLFLGFVAAGWTAMRRGRLAGLDEMIIWDLSMWILFSSIVGARTFYLIQYREKVFEKAETAGDYLRAVVSLPDGGLVLYGGVILGLLAYFLFCRSRKISPLLMGDVIMPSFFVGLAFGRIGCFFNGCCFGDRCELPWSVQFPLGSAPDMSLVERGFVEAAGTATLSLHPSQLYSSINALLLAFLTHSYFRYRHKDGAVLGLALITYPITRFVIEFLRGDELGKFHTSLTISQWVSLGLFFFGLIYLSWLSKRPAKLWFFVSRGNWNKKTAPSTK